MRKWQCAIYLLIGWYIKKKKEKPQKLLVIFLYLIHGWDNSVLHKLLSINTLKGDFSHNSKSPKTTTSKIKQLRIFLFWDLYCPLGRRDQFHGNYLFINRRQSRTSAMCTNLKQIESKEVQFIRTIIGRDRILFTKPHQALSKKNWQQAENSDFLFK